ncbi:MAG TPA: hypothetical protein VLY24_24470 [Bryobacteraceae bacterium]|nr:hypothetical protein [Bryobacteraceae bacterium]
MLSATERGKLEQLRAKTDQQLLGLISDELERAVRSELSGDSSQTARAYIEATRLLPLVRNISAMERARLEGRLDLLRDRLSEETTCIC